MGDDDHGDAEGRDGGDGIQNFPYEFGIECRSGFVKEDDIRFRCKRSGDSHALLHAAGKFRRIHVGIVCHADAGEFFHRDFFRFFFCFAVTVNQPFRDVFKDILVAEQIELLEDHGGFPPEFLHFRFGNMGKVHGYIVNGKMAGFGFSR